MPDLPRPLLRHTQPDHFVVAPESAVHHHAVCVLEERPNMRLDLQKAGSIEDRRSGLGIGTSDFYAPGLLEIEPHVRRSEEHTSELQSRPHLLFRLLL